MKGNIMDIEIVFTGNKKVEAHYKGHKIQVDQSINNGGDGTAPSPFDYFLTSIGTCAAYYVLHFCTQRNIPTDNIKVVQKMFRNDQEKRIEKIEIDINVPEDFPARYKEAIIKSANLCSVKKHILNPPEFEIKTVIK